jgi:hypothetical protein
MVLEVLHRSLVRLGCVSGAERTEVLSLASFGVLLARVQTKLARFQFPNHARILPVRILSARLSPSLPSVSSDFWSGWP